jgi:hypothetical protein
MSSMNNLYLPLCRLLSPRPPPGATPEVNLKNELCDELASPFVFALQFAFSFVFTLESATNDTNHNFVSIA